MDKINVLHFVGRDEGVAFSSAVFEPDLFESDEATLRDKGMGLIVALVLSLGLWVVIWLAVASFVSG
jgi:hypothetical protein